MLTNDPPLQTGGCICAACAGTQLREIAAYRRFHRVTSDSRPWRAGGRLWVCDQCGYVQCLADESFLREIEEIYHSYHIYHQSHAGAEQAVFEQGSGAAASRSRRLLEAVAARIQFPPTGRMLDIGCGNGAMLRAFSAFAPRWKLAGTELNDATRAVVESIPGAEKLYTCPLEQIPGQFDLATMSHVLEHVVEPVEFLRGVAKKLAPEGMLVIQVPGFDSNPFELLIADHRSHFTAATLRDLAEHAGFEVLHAGPWVPKELSVVARPRPGAIKGDGGAIKGDGNLYIKVPVPFNSHKSPAGVAAALAMVESGLNWLAEVVRAARQVAPSQPLGLLGTSNAAAWLAAELQERITFFVDEDPNRVGRTFMDRPVYSPPAVPAGSHVFVALPYLLATDICRRLRRPDVAYHPPPAI